MLKICSLENIQGRLEIYISLTRPILTLAQVCLQKECSKESMLLKPANTTVWQEDEWTDKETDTER